MTTTTDAQVFATDVSWADLRDRLERLRAELAAQLDEPGDERVTELASSATTGHGETEHIVSDVEQRVQAVLEARKAERLAELDDALQRLDDQTYGYCERCGAIIPLERLEAIPWARLCARCQVDEDARRRSRIAR